MSGAEIFIVIMALVFIIVWALIVNPPSSLIGRSKKDKQR